MKRNKIFTMILFSAIALSGTSFEAYGSSYWESFKNKTGSALSSAKGYVSSAAKSLSSSIASIPQSLTNVVNRLNSSTKIQLFIATGAAVMGKEEFDKVCIRLVRTELDRLLLDSGKGGVMNSDSMATIYALLPKGMNKDQWIAYATLLETDYREEMGQSNGTVDKSRVETYLYLLFTVIQMQGKDTALQSVIADLDLEKAKSASQGGFK